jgi:mono/diheme cytochrome c family protein
MLPACQQEMAKQPSYHPLEPSDFFPDTRSARPLPDGVLAQGQPRSAAPLVRYHQGVHVDLGRAVLAVTTPNLGILGPLAGFLAPASGAATEYASQFPIRIDEAAMRRGQERYTIFCVPCHDPLGTGHGKIVERGYLQPPSYHTGWSRGFEHRGIRLRLRDAPVGYYFEVVTKGFGGMPDYASQVPPEDRWKIIAYIRALQLSQYAPLDALSETARTEALHELEKQP